MVLLLLTETNKTEFLSTPIFQLLLDVLEQLLQLDYSLESLK